MNILHKQDLQAFYIYKNQLKSTKGIKIIKPKFFKKYRKLLKESNNQSVRVTACTDLEKLSQEYMEKHSKEDFLSVKEPDWEEKFYKIYNLEDKLFFTYTKGYIAVSETEFIEVCGNWLFFLSWALLGIIWVILLVMLCGDKTAPPEDPNSLKVDDSQTSWNGEMPNTTGNIPEQEDIEIPGFYRFNATAEAGNVPLYNPENNTVYFQYDIYEIVNTVEVGTYETAPEAQQYITENSTAYTLNKDNGYYLTDENGNKVDTVLSYKSVPSGDSYTVIQEELRAVYATDMVSPGNQVLWNAHNSLGTGEYTLKFVVSTYDIETGGECYGAVQTVEATIK